MNFVMFITPVFQWKFLSKIIEPGNHGYPTDEKINENYKKNYTDGTRRLGMLSMNLFINNIEIILTNC